MVNVSLPRWPRCRKYSTQVDHVLPSSQSSTSPTQVFWRRIKFLWPFFYLENKYKILHKIGSFLGEKIPKQRDVSFCQDTRRKYLGRIKSSRKKSQMVWRSAPGNSRVNISYWSGIHCFITYSCYVCRCSGGPFLPVRGPRDAACRRRCSAQIQQRDLNASSYREPKGPAPLLTFQYRVRIQEGPRKKADVAPWRAVYWPAAAVGPPGPATVP